MADIKYKRLTFARRRSFFAVAAVSRSSLWLGPDHLLLVEFNGYTETYKRFYFRDIQAITVRQTRRRAIWNAILLVPLIFCSAGLLATGFPPAEHIGAIVGWMIPITIFLVPFVINNIWGTACATQLRTAVQTEELPSLRRIRKTRKVLAQIHPLIAEAQGGEIPADVAATWMRGAITGEPQITVAEGSNLPPRSVS